MDSKRAAEVLRSALEELVGACTPVAWEYPRSDGETQAPKFVAYAKATAAILDTRDIDEETPISGESSEAVNALRLAAKDIESTYRAAELVRYSSVVKNKAAGVALKSTIQFLRDRADRLEASNGR